MEAQNFIHEKYPLRITLLANGVSALIYTAGGMILWPIGLWAPLLYLALILFLEIRLLAGSCRQCYYYGKRCFSGKGLVCALVFKRGNAANFSQREAGLKEIAPDILVVLIPIIGGCYVLFQGFGWPTVLLLVLLIFLAFPTTGYLRSNYACPHCRQRELGCPAERLFQKNKGSAN